MAIDFVVQQPCPVRQAIPEPKLAAMVRHRGVAQFAFQRFREAHPELDPPAILERCSVAIAITGPDGIARETPVSLGQLVGMTRELDAHRAPCAQCRANVADRDFGCFGKINYPLSREAEAWLVDRLPVDRDDPALTTLAKLLTDLKVDGAPVDRLRPSGRILAAAKPIVRRWSGSGGERMLNSSQLLQMLAFDGPINPRKAALFTRLLGLETILKEPHPPSDQIEQFKTFFCAVVMAGRLGSTIGVDA